MKAKERLAARLEQLRTNWDSAEASELVHLARDVYEGLVELRYAEEQNPKSAIPPAPPADRLMAADPMPSSPKPTPPAPKAVEVKAESPEPEQVAQVETAIPAVNSGDKKGPQPSKILIDFNDRWAFVNKLFDRNQDDFNRVISQLNTMSTFVEARNFVEHVVKTDYNWSEQEEFETRFMELIERHFN